MAKKASIGYKTVPCDMRQLDAVIADVRKKFPALVDNQGAKDGGGLSPKGTPMVPFAAKQGGKKDKNNPMGTVTVYYNGKISLSGALTSYRPPKSSQEDTEPATEPAPETAA